MNKKSLIAVALATAMLAGCAGNTVIQLDDDEYQINEQSAMSYSGGSVLSGLVQQARQICDEKGKKFKMIDNKTNDAYSSSTMYAGATVHFRCVNKD